MMERFSETPTSLQAQLRSAVRVAETRSSSQGSDCPICRGTGWERVTENGKTAVRQCICLRDRIRRRAMESIPERFRTASFENYIPTDARQESALEIVTQNTNGNLFLWGGYGRGKTHLASAQYR